VSGPDHRDVVLALAYRSWADGRHTGYSWSPEKIGLALADDPEITRLLVADPVRSRLSGLRPQPGAGAWQYDDVPTRRLVRPRRWRRSEPTRIDEAVGTYRRVDRLLQRQSSSSDAVLVSCHPVLAAVADRSRWADVVYYGWDDWSTYGLFAESHELIRWSYARMAERDVNVIGVTRAIVDRVGARRGTVVPNGVSAADFHQLVPVPSWFARLPGRIVFYAGGLENRIDVEAVTACARDLGPEWTVVLVGPMIEPECFEALGREPNVVVEAAHPRPEALAMMAAADVCLIPHRVTSVTVSMSPLKLFEYLAAGTPVVAADLPPVRGVSPRVVLVGDGEAYAPAVRKAAVLPPVETGELEEFRRAHDWEQRYVDWRRVALGG